MNLKQILISLFLVLQAVCAAAQVNTEQVMRVGQNALYFEDYMLSIQYFNRVIQSKPYLAKPYFLRAIAKLNLEDYVGAEQDATTAIDINPYLTDAWEVRGVARQNLGKNKDAISDYDHALDLIPRNRQLLYNKALAHSDLEDYEGADSTFRALLTYYPGFDAGYIGRARLNMQRGDTVSASEDIDKALSINKNAVNAYIMRADIAISQGNDLQAAAADLDEAIRLRPRLAGLYINRAYVRYTLDDLFGAMADFDYAIQLDPVNYTALFNRGLLLMSNGANDRALEDFNRILELRPDDTRAYFNRAIINQAKGRFNEAIDDINHVIDAYPGLPDAYYLRSELYHAKRDLNRASADYNKARRLARDLRPLEEAELAADVEPSTDEAARRFATMLTVDDNATMQEEYNNSAIRGRVQDRNIHIDPEGWMELAYYATPNELQSHHYYIKEVDEINATRMLRFTINVTSSIPVLDDETGARHFSSIDYYNSYLASHTPRAIDFIGRALDFMTVRDYTSAINDINRALALTPDLAVALYLRAQAAYHAWEADSRSPRDEKIDAATRSTLSRKALDDVIADLDRLVEISPRMAEGWYNKAVAHIAAGDMTSALSALNKAIELKPEMGEAWYNRGYIYLRLGNEPAGIADLSRAGQLGILPAYNLIKRISK